MLRTNHLYENVRDVYGDVPGSLSSERRKAFFKVGKPIEEVKNDLMTLDSAVDMKFYILPYGDESIVGMDI